MSAAAKSEHMVKQAREWARELVDRNQAEVGKRDLALAALADRLRVSKGRVWALLYRQQPDIYLSLYVALGEAYKNACMQQRRKFHSEAAGFRPGTPVGAAMARAADRLSR